jgi:nucleoside-diphosphate-sugar epimerase
VSFYDGAGPIPEEPFEDESYASLGYGLSKLVGERITAIASEKAGMDAAVVRIGQISLVILILLLLFILTHVL